MAMIAEKQKHWRANNPDKMRAYRRKWASENRDPTTPRKKIYDTVEEKKYGLRASKDKYRASAKGIATTAKYKRNGQRSADLKRLYKISVDQEQFILASQNGCCALCPATTRLGVDHDHLSGKVRGILCFRCNTAIGKLGDNETGILCALDYLRNPWQM